VIRALVAAFGRQRLSSPMRVVFVIMFLVTGVAPVLLTGSFQTLSAGIMNMFAFVFAAGAIGQDVSSGVLILTFARPVRRDHYVLSRWLGAGVLAAACVLLQVLAACGLVALRHGHLSVTLVSATYLAGVFAAFGLSAVIVMFSSFTRGLGDLALYVLAMILGQILVAVGASRQIGWLFRAGEEVRRFLDPSLDPLPWLVRGPMSWFDLASYLSTIAIALTVAIWAVNRRELSYASS
jgi:ABC-type transport system involved in multi-copper enzyme maturation permease subunit